MDAFLGRVGKGVPPFNSFISPSMVIIRCLGSYPAHLGDLFRLPGALPADTKPGNADIDIHNLV